MATLLSRVRALGQAETKAAPEEDEEEDEEPSESALSVSKLDVSVLEKYIGADWYKQRVHILDFSNSEFALTDLKPADFEYGSRIKKSPDKPVVNDQTKLQVFDVSHVHTLDVSFNLLEELDYNVLDGAHWYSLGVLRMRDNNVLDPLLTLPRLQELYLSYNNITRVPSLTGLPALTTLVLSHNNIPSVSMDAFAPLRKLHKLDLSDNQIMMPPSQLAVFFLGIGEKKVSHLAMSKNPCTVMFGEYQIMAVALIFTLTRIDDIQLARTAGLREEMVDSGNQLIHKGVGGEDDVDDNGLNKKRLRALDKIFKERNSQVKAGDKKATQPEHGSRGSVSRKTHAAAIVDENAPKLNKMIDLLDEVMSDPENAQSCVAQLFEYANKVGQMHPEWFKTIFEGAEGDNAHSGHVKAVNQGRSAVFCQQLGVAVERFPDCRGLLLRTLGKVSPVHEFDLGKHALHALARLMKCSNEMKAAVMGVVDEMVIPPIADKNMSDPSCAVVVIGLSKLDSDELAESLKEVMQQIIGFYKSTQSLNNHLSAGVIALLMVACRSPENTRLAVKEDLCTPVAMNLMDQRKIDNESLKETYENYVKIATFMLKHDPEESMNVFSVIEGGMHKKLITHMTTLLRRKDQTIELMLQHAKMIANLMNLVTDMMTVDTKDRCMREVAEDLMKTDTTNALVFKALKENIADTVLLASSLRCVRLFITKIEFRPTYLPTIIESMKLNKEGIPLLQVMGNEKFKPMYERAELHVAADRGAANAGIPQVPSSLSDCTNPIVQTFLVEAIGLIQVFTDLADEDDTCKEVSGVLNNEGREKILFRLLQVPSEDVQKAVMSCIAQVELEELESEEIGYLIKMLDPQKTAEQESLQMAVFDQLRKLCDAEGAGGADIFKNQYCKVAVERSCEVLAANASRSTYGNPVEEDSKRKLSMAAVALMMSVSGQELLRKFLRTRMLNQAFRHVLRMEEMLHSWSGPDILIEMTWTGRSVENLLGCLGGAEAVSKDRKQGFRVIQRCADVMEGRPDNLDAGRPFTIYDRGTREAKWWDETRIHRQLQYLDDSEWEDRTLQQQSFVSFNGLERVLHFLERGNATDEKVLPTDTNPAVRLVIEAQELQKDAVHFLERLRASGQEQEGVLQTAAAEEKARNTPNVVGQMEEEVVDPRTAREILLQTNMATMANPGVDPEQYNVQKATPTQLRTFETLFQPNGTGKISRSFMIAAFLRNIFVLLMFPVVQKLRADVLKWMREPLTELRLIALLESCECYTNCHVVSKFLRVSALALRLTPDRSILRTNHDPVKSTNHVLINLDITAGFVGMLLELIAPLISRFEKGRTLVYQQQLLVIEATRVFKYVVEIVPRLHIVDTPEVQAECVSVIFARFMPLRTVHHIFGCLLYDMQVDIGSSHGRYIDERFVRNSLDRQGMREFCTEVLATYIHWAPKHKYDAFAMFNEAEIFGQRPIRLSYMHELLQRINFQKYMNSTEHMLKEHNDNPDEHILFCTLVDIPLLASNKVGMRDQLLVCTNRMCYIMEKPDPKKVPICGVCPPERFCPIGPSTTHERQYKDLTRVIRGLGPQMFAVGYVEYNKLTGQVDGETLDVVICHGVVEARNRASETLHNLSGPDVENRVEMVPDAIMRQLMRKKTHTEELVCHTYAYRKEGTTHRMGMFVLSETDFYDFEVHWEHWICPLEEINELDGGNDVGPKWEDDLDQDELAPLEDRLARMKHVKRTQPTFVSDYQAYMNTEHDSNEKTYRGSYWHGKKQNFEALAQLRESARQNSKQGVKEPKIGFAIGGKAEESEESPQLKQRKAVNYAKQNLLSQVAHHSLSHLSEIVFEPTEEPVLQLVFNTETVNILFFDDVARETWRRGLAFVLNKSDTASQWHRDWENI